MKYIIAQPNKTGRLGHQFQNMCVGLALSSKIINLEYIHSTFFGPSRKWEEVLNFTKKFKNPTGDNCHFSCYSGLGS